MTKIDPVCQYITDHRDEYFEKYPSQWTLIEFNHRNPVARHIIHLNHEYRQIVSYTYFTDRELGRGFGSKKVAPKHFGSSEHRAGVELLSDARKLHPSQFNSFADNLPIFEHDTIWDFYNSIGYDYKKKKYI